MDHSRMTPVSLFRSQPHDNDDGMMRTPAWEKRTQSIRLNCCIKIEARKGKHNLFNTQKNSCNIIQSSKPEQRWKHLQKIDWQMLTT